MRPRGTIRSRSPGSYRIRYSLGRDPVTGKRRFATTTIRGTRKDAERELVRLLRTVDTGEHVDPSRMTVGQWLAHWVEVVRTEVSPKTHERYAEIVRDHLVPAFGKLALTKLTPNDMQKVYTAWATGGRRDGKLGGLSPRTRLHLHRVFGCALGRAVEQQVLSRNPA